MKINFLSNIFFYYEKKNDKGFILKRLWFIFLSTHLMQGGPLDDWAGYGRLSANFNHKVYTDLSHQSNPSCINITFQKFCDTKQCHNSKYSVKVTKVSYFIQIIYVIVNNNNDKNNLPFFHSINSLTVRRILPPPSSHKSVEIEALNKTSVSKGWLNMYHKLV